MTFPTRDVVDATLIPMRIDNSGSRMAVAQKCHDWGLYQSQVELLAGAGAARLRLRRQARFILGEHWFLL